MLYLQIDKKTIHKKLNKSYNIVLNTKYLLHNKTETHLFLILMKADPKYFICVQFIRLQTVSK